MHDLNRITVSLQPEWVVDTEYMTDQRHNRARYVIGPDGRALTPGSDRDR